MFTVFGQKFYHTAGLASALLMFLSGAQHVQASSSDAWEEFRQSVEEACLKASSGGINVKSIQVDPYGSESYGFAVVFGTEVGSATERLIACAYDKISGVAEISSPFDR